MTYSPLYSTNCTFKEAAIPNQSGYHTELWNVIAKRGLLSRSHRLTFWIWKIQVKFFLQPWAQTKHQLAPSATITWKHNIRGGRGENGSKSGLERPTGIESRAKTSSVTRGKLYPVSKREGSNFLCCFLFTVQTWSDQSHGWEKKGLLCPLCYPLKILHFAI